MDNDLQEVYVDAISYNSGIASAQDKNENYEELIKVSNEFSKNDLKTAFFLLMDQFHSDPKKFLDLVKMDETKLREAFMQNFLNFKINKYCLFELVGTMKKYKLLREIGLCKHNFKRSERRFKNIPENWKTLYSLCENLSDEETCTLKKNLLPDLSEDISAEEFLCHLLSGEKISFEDLSALKFALEVINRRDLVKDLGQLKTNTNSSSCRPRESSNLYNIRNPTPESPCGLAVIINQEKYENCKLQDRKGTDCDKVKLKNVWKSLGFCIHEYNDLTAKEITRLFKDISLKDFSMLDVFVACILSHGTEGGICGSDSEIVNIKSLISTVANNCSTLVDKPKLFFIQACQGENHQKGVCTNLKGLNQQSSYKTDSLIESETSPTPENCDVYEAFATCPGYVSYRDEINGSIFVMSLSKHLEEYGTREDINSVMNRVKDDIAKKNIPIQGVNCKQMPITTSTLRKDVIFKYIKNI